MSEFNLEIFLKNLPLSSGVYRMMAADDTVLYVGKAVNLKRRVSSYFHKNDHSPRIQLMLKQVARVDITLTNSEAEALILENNLIKSLAPKYNILFRDDKSYPYLMLSGHDFPRLAYFRGTPKKPHQFFGPYPNGYAVRDSIDILQKVFQLRTCEDSVFAHRDRACLLHQIKRCAAPCVNAISAADYAEQVKQATLFLNGKTADLFKTWQQNMVQAAERLDFEAAAKWRDQIQALTVVQSKQFIDSHQAQNQQDIDVIAVLVVQGAVCVHWVSIRGGRHVGDKNFFPDTRHDPNPQAQDYAEAFVVQHYLGKMKPDVLILNFRLPENVQAALNAEHGKKMAFVVAPERGERKVWLNMAMRNAEQALSQYLLQNTNQKQRIVALAEILGLPENELRRLECFDISHTQGEATVASCVVYDDFAMQPKQYRRYNIATAQAGDDYAAMREVLTRRYGKMVQAAAQGEAVRFPDVVLIDGGKGQVNVALAVWAELGLTVPIVGIAKGVERKAGLEELILPVQYYRHSRAGGNPSVGDDILPLQHENVDSRLRGNNGVFETFRLPENHPALHLLQTIRDESHRFAITGMRAKRDKARVQSSLNDIAGVGAKRKAALLLKFGGLRGVQAASVDDLANVDGISRDLAQKIYDYFHGG